MPETTIATIMAVTPTATMIAMAYDGNKKDGGNGKDTSN